MQTSQETTNLFKSMIEAAPEIQSISKSKQAYGYKYATLDNLIDMLRSVLPNHGLWFTQMPTRIDGKSTLTTRVIHSSGEWIEDSIEMTDTELQGKANDTQKIGASITYFRRYALSSIFGVSVDEDVDGNLNNRQVPQQQKQPQKQPQPSQPAQPKEKLDPQQYVLSDYGERTRDGETVESVLRDYQQLIKLAKPIELKDYSDAEMRSLAVALFGRKRAK